MKITVINPYDDEKLVYNQNTDRYELSLTYVRENFDDNLQDDGIMQKRVSKNSRKIYNYILGRSYTANRLAILFLLNRTAEGRKFLFDVLTEQLEADFENGFNDLTLNPSINISNGANVGRNEIRANKVSVDTEDLIESSDGYFGINLVYQGMFPPELFRFVRLNERK